MNRRRLFRLGFWLLGLFILSTVISVNTFPVITNDSLAYIGHSNDLAGFGWVNFGYRQFGYPLSLAFERTLADVITIEPLLFTAALQRFLLLGAGALAVFVWRWWSIPLVSFLLAAETLAYPNLILTEGLSLSIAVGLAVLVARFLQFLRSEEDERQLAFWLLGGLILTMSLILLTIRFPFAVFGISPLIVVIASWRTAFRKPAIVLFGVYLVLSTALVVLLSAENAEEYGVFFPTVQGERAKYWAAWTLVFVTHDENGKVSELAAFYDGGSPYGLIREVDSSNLTYAERRAAYESAIEELLTTADIPLRASQWESFLWSLRGGRVDDIGGTVEAVTRSTRRNVDTVINRNRFVREKGVEAFAEQFNRSQEPEAVLTDQIGQRLPLPAGKTSMSVLLPISLLVMILGLAAPRTRWLSLTGLVVVVTYAAAIGSVRADNYRFLITTSSFGIAIATAVLVSLTSRQRESGSRPWSRSGHGAE